MISNTQLFLGIDTSTPWRSVGLSDSENWEVSLNWKATRTEGKDPLPKVQEILAVHGRSLRDLSGIAVACGPGSFTALRVGVSLAQGLGMGLGIPVAPIGSLETYPHILGSEPRKATVLLPARSGEVFVQTYVRERDLRWKKENVIECLTVEGLGARVKNPGILVGPGLHYYEEDLRAVFGDNAEFGGEESRIPSGGILARLGGFEIQQSPENFPPGAVRIEYHQSHGALTISERKGVAHRD